MVWGRLVIAFWVPRLILFIRATLGHGIGIMSDYRKFVQGRAQTILRSGCNNDFLDGNLITISKAKLHVGEEMILDIGVGHLPRGGSLASRSRHVKENIMPLDKKSRRRFPS